MANAFNIDKGGNTTSDTHLINETFHVFSKSPASPTTTLGGARLKSGHTTTASDVWVDEIPAFFKAATQTKFDLFENTKAVKDDLCLFNGNVYRHNGTKFETLGAEDVALYDGATFSKNGKEVIKFHKGRTAINLTADNNNGDGSNNYSAKIYDAAENSTLFVPQFISAMDKMVDGIPSLGYDAAVFDGSTKLAEGLTNDNDYICNAYAGVIQFNKARESKITVNAWEYIGDKLDNKLTDNKLSIEELYKAVFGDESIPGGGAPDGGESIPDNLATRVTKNEGTISELERRVTANEGSISELEASVTANEGAISELEGHIDENIQALSERISANEGAISELEEHVEESIQALSESVTTNEGDIDKLNTTFNGLKNAVFGDKTISPNDTPIVEEVDSLSNAIDDLNNSNADFANRIEILEALVGSDDNDGTDNNPSLLNQVLENKNNINDLTEKVCGESGLQVKVGNNEKDIQQLWMAIYGGDPEEPEEPGDGVSPDIPSNNGNLLETVEKNKEDIISINNTVSELQTDLNDFKSSSDNNYNSVIHAIASHSSDTKLHGGSGINVYSDVNKDYEADLTPISGVKDIKFFGEYVNVVDNKDGTISLYFGENKNPAELNTVSAAAVGDNMYIYSDSGDSYKTGPLTIGEQYDNCQSVNTPMEYTCNEGKEITIPSESFKIKVEIIRDNVSLISAESSIIDGSNIKQYDTNNGITISATDIIKNTNDDAKKGMTPNFIRCKISITINNGEVMSAAGSSAGGYYKIKVTINNVKGIAMKDCTTEKGVFAYNIPSSDPSIGKVTAEYKTEGDPKVVSGIEYDKTAYVKLTITGINNTQWMVTKNRKRINVIDNSTRLADIGDLGVDELSIEDGSNAAKNNTSFYYSKDITFTKNHTPAKMNGFYTVTPYKPVDGSAFSAAAVESNSFSGTRYLWNGDDGTENDATSSFHTDGKRLAYTVLTDGSGNVTGLDLDPDSTTYVSNISLVDEGIYNKQLLVQGGSLMYPTEDITGTYIASNCTGTRYWTKLIKTNDSSSDTQTVFTISGTNLNSTSLSATGEIKFWAVAANTKGTVEEGKKAVLLNATGANGGFATSISNTSIKVEIPGGEMTCFKDKAFYLVVQIPSTVTTKLGAITVA